MVLYHLNNMYWFRTPRALMVLSTILRVWGVCVSHCLTVDRSSGNLELPELLMVVVRVSSMMMVHHSLWRSVDSESIRTLRDQKQIDIVNPQWEPKGKLKTLALWVNAAIVRHSCCSGLGADLSVVPETSTTLWGRKPTNAWPNSQFHWPNSQRSETGPQPNRNLTKTLVHILP